MVNRTDFYYFSPTGGTKKVGEAFCKAISGEVMDHNLGLREKEPANPAGELAVFAAPVFGGRIPALVADKIKALDGSGKKAVTFVVYGTRAYEDALLELNQAVSHQGFQIAASGACIAQHSMAPDVGKGRPDEKDVSEITGFAKRVESELDNRSRTEITVPGNQPYKEAMTIPAPPISLETCSLCGKCEEVCPTAAITVSEGHIATDPNTCILCMACTAVCPNQSRILPPPLQERMEQMLGALKDVRRENEFFIL